MTTFFWIGLIFAAWFAVSVFVVVLLYALAIHWQERRERLQERLGRLPSPVPDYLPASWEHDVLDRRTEA